MVRREEPGGAVGAGTPETGRNPIPGHPVQKRHIGTVGAERPPDRLHDLGGGRLVKADPDGVPVDAPEIAAFGQAGGEQVLGAARHLDGEGVDEIVVDHVVAGIA